ncbi:YitT family protein [Alkalihalobacillus sp. LMS39]|uniref:YitT family protein n=1 Tax=Alkalihalobacillus sp. LMS39 TaxID=2924032 RepID=UPI001FB289AE|nr:YitT family protein [Alkalihalobacillus sp. LMS39]UOE92538.1 YitT family protein [Alkalihalobacillus sp. LMS39]
MLLLKKYCLITAGGIIQGFAMAIFLFPHSIPSGGAGGIAVLLNYWFAIPIGFALWLVNFSLLVVAIKWLGNASAMGTMYGITITSLTIYFFQDDMYRPSTYVWFDLLIGSLLLGIGVGLLLRQGVSNGGMGVLALLFATYRNTLPGKPLFFMNGSIFILTALVIDWGIIIKAIISQWVSTKVVDFIYHIKIQPSFNPSFRTRKR